MAVNNQTYGDIADLAPIPGVIYRELSSEKELELLV
jgi:hypothetical protein